MLQVIYLSHILYLVFLFYLNELLYFSDSGVWSKPDIIGSPPCPRTCHSMASIGDKLFVFAGGLSGPDPVTDTQMHVFDAGNHCFFIVHE